MATTGKLATKHRRAIAALLVEGTVEQAAKKAKVGFRTLCRWLAEDEDFRLALAAAEADLVSQAARSIAAGSTEAIAALRAIVADRTALRRERIAAANSILTHMPKMRLLGSLEQAIEELQRINDAKSNRSS